MVRPGGEHPADAVTAVRRRAETAGVPVVGVRPVTDTVKRLDADGFVVDTVDRETLRTPEVVVAPTTLGDAFASVLAAVTAGPHEVHEI